MVVSLTMTIMRLFDVNSRNTPWKVREITTYMSTFWFTYLHTSDSNTMLPNKLNVMLETIGIFFLVTSHDIYQPICLTSESNDHTYGHWRNIFSELNI